MKLNIKLLSLLLAAVTLCGSLTCFSSVTAFAADEVAEETPVVTPTEKEETIDYTTKVYGNPDEKLADMELRNKTGDYEIYAHTVTGEVAVRNTKSGQVLFTNPYDVASSKGSVDIKYELLSQLIVKYVDNGTEKVFTSYEMAAMRDQIKVKNIKHGVRVEYTIGREETRRLVPRQIVDESFQKNILTPMLEYFAGDDQNFYYQKFLSYYEKKDLDELTSDKLKDELLKEFPIVEKYDIWVFDDESAGRETALNYCEEWVKTCCPNYGFEEMDADHQLTEYVAEDENPPVFKMALEYTLDKDGLSVRLPANGIRFNESLYQLSNITVLPYMGAGNSNYSGYTFYPDGSGALFSFEDLDIAAVTTISSKVYGTDYAYQKLSGTYQETVRFPVFGVVEDTEYYDYRMFEDDAPTRLHGVLNDKVELAVNTGDNDPALKPYKDAISDKNLVEKVVESQGYVAVIEEGDALAEIQTYHAGMTGDYNSIKMLFNPRPSDSYNLADSISVGSNSEWTVVSSRKYVGSYKIRYTMLTDDELAAEKNLDAGTYYSATWLGMAFAYRDYLEKNGMLSRLKADQLEEDIPLYIESFGAVEATEKILSIPVDVMKPLTTFEDVKSMYDELSGKGVSNINFKLTGYAEGGMYSSIPSKIDWENVVEKSAKTDDEAEKSEKVNVSLQDLLDYAEGLEEGRLGIYPDFDFAYAATNTTFDSLIMRRHVVKTIDDRYASRREYSPTMQKYLSYFQLAISPAYYDTFYTKLTESYEKKYENLMGMSVGSLGNALNSDFDEDEPYNREDSKAFVIEALDYLSNRKDGKMELMVDGGNAYTWPYVDHILGVALDSSRYIKASYSVPFVGVVLHGYVNFTGTPLNMEGDVNYAKLKAMENGASVYFTLSYRNTQELKDYYLLSQYYSIRYDIWKDDVVALYNELNHEMGDVQDKLIVDHVFLDGTRVADTDELSSDIRNEYEAALKYQENKAENERKEILQAMANARENIANVETLAETLIANRLTLYSGATGSATIYATGDASFYNTLSNYVNADNEYKRVLAVYEAASDEEKEALELSYTTAADVRTRAYNQLKTSIFNVKNKYATWMTQYQELTALLELAEGKKGAILINGTPDCPESIKDEIREQLENTKEMMERELGISINRSPNKLEADTFLYAHVANLFTDICEDNEGLSQAELAQKTFEVVSDGVVGLSKDDLASLRYLASNKNKSDAELMAKYGIPTDGSNESGAGLVTYLKELLSETDAADADFEANVKAVFDPAMSMGEIDAFLDAYFHGIVAKRANGLHMPELKGLVTELNTGKSAVTVAAGNEITKIRKGLSKGEYPDLTTLVTDKKMEEIIDALEAALLEKDAAYESTPVNREFLKAYFVTYYYQNYYNAVKYDELNTQMVAITSTSDTSLKLLFDDRYKAVIDAYDEKENNDYLFVGVLKSILEDAEFQASIQQMADRIGAAEYGEDLVERLTAGFVALFAESVLKGLKKDKTPELTFTDDYEAQFKADIAAAKTFAEVETIAAELVAEMGGCTEEEALQYAAYLWYQTAKNQKAKYYYDAQMGLMDASVQEKVAERVAEIRAEIQEGDSDYQVWDRVLAALADPEDPLSEFVNTVCESITYGDKNGNQAPVVEAVQAYFCYLLFAEFEGEHGLVYSAPAILTEDLDLLTIVRTNTQSFVKELAAKAKSQVARGQMPNYAMSAVCTDEELTAKATEFARWCMDEREEDFGELVSQLKDYIRYYYYQEEVRNTRLAANKLPTMPVEDQYCDVSVAGERIIKLMDYYALLFTDLTQEDLDAMAKPKDEQEQEEEDEFNKYGSDEGKLVAVTYGDRNADGTYSKYKTFLLNYNDFSVRVTYNGVVYTIPSYGYVSLYV